MTSFSCMQLINTIFPTAQGGRSVTDNALVNIETSQGQVISRCDATLGLRYLISGDIMLVVAVEITVTVQN